MSNVFCPPVQEVMIKGESVVVKDPSLHKILIMLRDAKSVLIKLTSLGKIGEGDVIGNFTDFLSDPEIFKGFCQCASACTSKPADFFMPDETGEGGISISETAALIAAMQTAVNWQVLKELFHKMMPTLLPPPMTLPNLQDELIP
jgi:hypothetical protein